MRRYTRAGFSVLWLLLCAPSASAGVIYAGTDQLHRDLASTRTYSGAIFDSGDLGHRLGSVSLIDDGNWLLGSFHAIDDGTGQPRPNLSVAFGTDVYSSPTEIISLAEVYTFGPPTIQSSTDWFLARLTNKPLSASPIQRWRGPITIGVSGFMTGYGDLYEAGVASGLDDGKRRTGTVDIDGIFSASYFYSDLRPLNFPGSQLEDMGGSPGLSGGTVEILDGLDAPFLAGIASAVSGGFDESERTYHFDITTINPIIDSIVPEPATLSLMLVGGVFAIRRRRA